MPNPVFGQEITNSYRPLFLSPPEPRQLFSAQQASASPNQIPSLRFQTESKDLPIYLSCQQREEEALVQPRSFLIENAEADMVQLRAPQGQQG